MAHTVGRSTEINQQKGKKEEGTNQQI